MSAKQQKFWRDESGAAMVEFTVAVMTFFLILFGTIEFSFLYYQWNAATKAVQWGARLAAVSNPVANDLLTLTGMEGGALPGDPMPSFDYTCALGDTGCSDLALQMLVYGRDASGAANTGCVGNPAVPRLAGMCNFFDRIEAENVVVRYQYTGLGYAGRPGGAVPTVTVSLTNLTFDFVFLSGLMGFTSVNLPGLETTVTGEDLRVSGS